MKTTDNCNLGQICDYCYSREIVSISDKCNLGQICYYCYRRGIVSTTDKCDLDQIQVSATVERLQMLVIINII